MDGNRQSYQETLSTEEQHTPNGISVEQLQHLVRLLDGSDVSELEVKQLAAGTRLVLRKAQATEHGSLQGNAVPVASVTEDIAPTVEKHYTVAAPLVGIFHTWAKPKGKPLVSVGDHVKAGQRVGTIQSLNVFNEVESLETGRIVEIIVQDGQPVEYGQPLMIIEDSEEM